MRKRREEAYEVIARAPALEALDEVDRSTVNLISIERKDEIGDISGQEEEKERRRRDFCYPPDAGAETTQHWMLLPPGHLLV